MDNIIAAQSEEDEGAVQEPAWTYYERLSYIFGADSTCIGISNDMDFPDWYSGCFVNDRNRLTINIIGDTLKTRRMLAKLLQGNEFDLGVGVSSRKEMLRTLSLLDTAVSNMDTLSPSPICREAINGNLIWWGNEDGTITICIEGDSDSIINVFRKDVFDSPLLRFEVHDKVRVNIGCDTLAVEEKSFVSHETSQQFPGGDGAMISYIYDNLRYPKEAYDENIQGRVVVQYLVDKTGNIDSVRIVKSKDPYLDAEAVRIVTSFPKFTPGKFDLTPIDQWMTLPIMFKKTDYDDRKNKKYRAFQYDNGDDYVKDGLFRIV
ncbi:MAG: energy transducer TonB, partial [Duncaniella sp.]|nr:energy transducer TonB [Duncaniella sp.]